MPHWAKIRKKCNSSREAIRFVSKQAKINVFLELFLNEAVPKRNGKNRKKEKRKRIFLRQLCKLQHSTDTLFVS